MKKKLIIIIIVVSVSLVMFFTLISSLFCFNFFGSTVINDYIENNREYAEDYIDVLNKNIKYGNGYVSLSRILYFYLEDSSLTFDEIYTDNLDIELKSELSISDVCRLNKYKSFSVCKSDEINESDQIDDIQIKPFKLPLKQENMNITSFFMQERIVYDNEDIHPAWDFSSPNETEVYSVCDGKVKKVNFKYDENIIDINGGGGNTITLKCIIDDVEYEILYAHLYPNSSLVKTGANVKSGEIIAKVGTTGYSTGSHLHFEVKVNSKQIDGLSLINFNEEK